MNANSSVNVFLHQRELLEWVLHYGRDVAHSHLHTRSVMLLQGACHTLLSKVHLFDIHITQVTLQRMSLKNQASSNKSCR